MLLSASAPLPRLALASQSRRGDFLSVLSSPSAILGRTGVNLATDEDVNKLLKTVVDNLLKKRNLPSSQHD